MEFIFELLLEFGFQFLVEGCFDLLFGQTLSESRPLGRFFFFLSVGAILGGLSLLVFREHLIAHRGSRYAAALIVPVLVACAMAWIGQLRVKRGSKPNGLEYFFSSWAFAFAFGAVRVAFAK